VTDASQENKEIARRVASVFGGNPAVQRFYDESDEHFVDILASHDAPQEGLTSYSTIGLSDWGLFLDGKEYPARVELVGACESSVRCFEEVLATAAFCIINTKWFCAPGVIFEDVVAVHQCSKTMRHLMLIPPFLWDGQLETLTLEFPKKTVAWLLAVPVSQSELEYASKNGPDKLEDLFEQEQIDIFDIDREPVV